jgi:hypothetical protein
MPVGAFLLTLKTTPTRWSIANPSPVAEAVCSVLSLAPVGNGKP